MQYSRQQVVDMLRRWGLAQLADEAKRTLPDQVDADQLEAWAMRNGISRDDLISWFGGSP
jgi:hypothetical protein